MALRNYKYETAEEQNGFDLNFKVLKNKTKAVKKVKRSKATLVVSLMAIFTMLIIINYRNNLIAEKNLLVQRLEIEKTEVDAMLTNAQVSLSRMTDLTEVDAYAKQQLGMQEPEKNQMVYINTGIETEIKKAEDGTFISNLVSNIKQMINNIF